MVTTDNRTFWISSDIPKNLFLVQDQCDEESHVCDTLIPPLPDMSLVEKVPHIEILRPSSAGLGRSPPRAAKRVKVRETCQELSRLQIRNQLVRYK